MSIVSRRWQKPAFIDLTPNECTQRDCNRCYHAISRAHPSFEPFGATDLRKVSEQHPVLLVLRSCSPARLIEGLDTVRTYTNRPRILAVVCNLDALENGFAEFARLGIDDFVSCPYRDVDLLIRVQRLLPQAAESSSGPGRFGSLVGTSRTFLDVLDKIPTVARSDATVMLRGETGTGKELIARAIHYDGPRRGRPFVPVNCGAIPDNLVENELFGHARGAFTDAATPESGLVTEAGGGTLFLDEIDALSMQAQVKILRLLQEGEYRALGSSKISRANVRIIAATNSKLEQRVEAQAFREDLYHRLNVLSLQVPPLRERLEDIVLLAKSFLVKYRDESVHGEMQLAPSALQKLLNYEWPGNVRELERTIRRAVILASRAVLSDADIDLPAVNRDAPSPSSSFQRAKNEAITSFERVYLTNLLVTHRGNVSRAARASGKERRSLQRLLSKYSLDHRCFA